MVMDEDTTLIPESHSRFCVISWRRGGGQSGIIHYRGEGDYTHR